jgi:hypothetical protein
MTAVRDNKALNRFELDVGESVAFAIIAVPAIASSSRTPKRRPRCAAAVSRRSWSRARWR